MKNRIQLSGCRAEPLAGYLKSLGVLKLLYEQGHDRNIKSCWDGETFSLETVLDDSALIDFFLREYRPSPVVAPWNGGSGFAPGDNQDAFNAILNTDDGRFESYKKVIAEILCWPELPKVPANLKDLINIFEAELKTTTSGSKKEKEYKTILKNIENVPISMRRTDNDYSGLTLDAVEKAQKKDKTLKEWWNSLKKARTEAKKLSRGAGKEIIIMACRSRLPEEALPWVDASCIVSWGQKPEYNPVLGTGGNEGRLDFSNNFMQHVVNMLLKSPENCEDLLRNALLKTPAKGMVKASIGQFDPGMAGGFNQGNEIETKNFAINPWDFILMIEGSMMLAGAVTKRLNGESGSALSSPFTVRSSPVGYATSSQSEKARAETWLPLWDKPASFNETVYLFREGRVQIKYRPVKTGLDFTRAIGTLGVDRGITQFIRYSFLERRGQSYVALPVDKIPVHFQPQLRFLEELDMPLRDVDSFIRKFITTPATIASQRRRIDELIFDCCLSATPANFQNLLKGIGRLERSLATRDRGKQPALKSPVSGLSSGWLNLCDDNTVELRIAAALASIGGSGSVGPLRSNLAGVAPTQPWKFDSGSGQKCWFGNNFANRLVELAWRRMLDAQKNAGVSLPYYGSLALRPDDIMDFLYGRTDDQRIEELMWGFSWVRWQDKGVRDILKAWSRPVQEQPVSRSWLFLKLALSSRLPDGRNIKPEVRIVPLLRAGRFEDAWYEAERCLRCNEVKPFKFEHETNIEPRRLLASLIIPASIGEYHSRLVLAAQK